MVRDGCAGWARTEPEFLLVHCPRGRDGYVQVAQGKLQEHAGTRRTGKDSVVSACVYLEVRESSCASYARVLVGIAAPLASI